MAVRFLGTSLRGRLRAAGGGAAPTYVLDSVGTSSIRGAYYLRRLFATYSGPLIQLRSSLNRVVDVSADENDPGKWITGNSSVTPTTWGSTLSAFIASDIAGAGTGDAFLAVLYDQSGNSRNSGQATTSAQFQLYTAGVLNTVIGVSTPGVPTTNARWAGWGHTLQTNAFTSGTNNCLLVFVGSVVNGQGTALGTWDGGNSYGTSPSNEQMVFDSFNPQVRAARNNISGGPSVNSANARRMFSAEYIDSTSTARASDGTNSGTASFSGTPTVMQKRRWYLNRGADNFTGGGNNGGTAEGWLVCEPTDPTTFANTLRGLLI